MFTISVNRGFRSYIVALLLLLSFPMSVSSKSHSDSLLQVAQTTLSDSVKCDIFLKISKKHSPNSFDSAFFYGQKALALATNLLDTNLIIESYKQISLAYDYQYKIDSTLTWYNKALKIALLSKNNRQLIKLYNQIGIAYFYKTQYDKSIENLYKALEYSEQIIDSTGIARCCNNIGYIYEKQGNSNDALKFFKRALEIGEKINSKRRLIPALYNISKIYFKISDNKLGMESLDKALSISKEIKDTSFMTLSYSYLAISYANSNNLKRSNIYLQKSLKYRSKVKDKYLYGQLLCDLGATYAKMSAFNEAEKSYLESIEINTSVRPELLLKSYEELSRLYRNNNKYKTALEYSDKFIAFKDSIYNIEKEKAISTIQAKFETEKKERQINQLKASVEQQKLKRKFWIWVSALTLLIALLFVFFLFSYKRRSAELERRNNIIKKTLAERDLLFKEIHHRVKNNLQLVSSILSLQVRYLKNKGAIDAIKASQNRINSISLIHQKLYKKNSITGIRVKDYIDDLVVSIIDSFVAGSVQIKYASEIENLLLEVDTVVPMGLIINELITNSIKHNVGKSELFLFIKLNKKGNTLFLSIKDNGKGVSEEFMEHRTDSYGMRMIESLSKKLKATVEFINHNGLVVELSIMKFKEINR
jgi:two-component sensor histidine kinase